MTLISSESTFLCYDNRLMFQALAHCSKVPFRARHALVNKDLWQLLDSKRNKKPSITLMMHCLVPIICIKGKREVVKSAFRLLHLPPISVSLNIACPTSLTNHEKASEEQKGDLMS